MKVEVKLKADHIGYLSGLFEQYGRVEQSYLARQARETKVLISICMDISDKFSDKFKKISRTPAVFNKKKLYGTTLKYYEAHAIAVLLLGCKNNETDQYKKDMAGILYVIFDEKLR